MDIFQFFFFVVCFGIGYLLPDLFVYFYRRIKYGNR